MNTARATLSLLSLSVLCAVTGCGAASAGAEDGASSEEELRSRDCPPGIDVLLRKPSIKSDAQLVSAWARDMESYESHPREAAEEQLTRLASHIEEARTQKAVHLRGTVRRACAYETVDANTGEPNGYRVWFAKTAGRNGQLQLRIERQLDAADDALFFKAPLTSLSPTSVEVDPSKSAFVYAQHHETGYHGEPEGPNAWIGSAKVTVTLAE